MIQIIVDKHKMNKQGQTGHKYLRPRNRKGIPFLLTPGTFWDPRDIFGTPRNYLGSPELFGTHLDLFGTPGYLGTQGFIWDPGLLGTPRIYLGTLYYLILVALPLA